MVAAGAAGVISPLIGGGTAQAASGSSEVDDYYPIPEESGSIPWW
jgi:hypothetical protein